MPNRAPKNCGGKIDFHIRKKLKANFNIEKKCLALSVLVFWDFCAERRARINNLTAKNLFHLQGRNAHFTVMGEEGDISNLCQFNWYDWCYFHDGGAPFPITKQVLGRVLGPAKGQGNEMCQWILKSNGKVVPRRTVRRLLDAELHSETEKRKRKLFDELITRRWGTSFNPPPQPVIPDNFEEYEDDNEEPRLIPEMEDPVDNLGQAIHQQPTYDKMIHAEVVLAQGDRLWNAKVIGRSVGPDGLTTGTFDDNPILNSVTYDVEFPDREVREYAANVIAENLLSQVDDEGFTVTLLDSTLKREKNS